MDKISLIVPCYNERDAIPIFYEKISETADMMSGTEFEYIFVNDGSRDDTLGVIKGLAEKDSRVKYVSFSRNFGKESAMYAGMEYSSGDYVVIMDVDLQDPPSLLPQMYADLKGGEYDCVASRRVDRKGEAKIRSFFARCFYKIINKISQTEIVDGARDFRMMTRQMTDSVLNLGEYNRFSKGIFSWVGYNTKWLEYENRERVAGETKWSFIKLFKYSLDGIMGFSTMPLAIASFIGLMFFFASIVGIIFIVVRQLIWGGSAYGWASMVCIMLLVSGIQLLCTGIVGQYLAKAYLEVKRRPIYIAKETNIEMDRRD
ncbi:MAG: glycosyltransferase family 2 protein [Oscillospiraceae bacterium]|nr:glycosyltransferase family 2 protein [Oscillospiraceae bacterium]